MSCKVQQSVCSDCVTYVKSRIKFNTFNTFNNVDDILPLSEDGAYLVFASSESCKTSFVCYEDGTAYFLSDWQGCYPVSENAIAEFNNWVTIDWKESPVIFNGLPRVLFDLN